MTHNIKILETFSASVLNGDKPFEIRKNDRGYQKGDMIRFNVVDDWGLHVGSELNKHTYRITYVLSGWGISEGYVALGIRREEDERKETNA